jgi:diamine N-acetyltransferase
MTIIRDAVIEDMPIIRTLALAIWPVTYGQILSKEQLTYMLDLIYSFEALDKAIEEGHRFLILEIDKAPVGFAGFSAIDPPGAFKLHKLYVLPEHQGAGLGRRLLDQVINIISTLEADCLQLNVNRNNKAKHFYEKLGFRVIRQEDIDIGSGYFMNDYIMQYDLEGEQ